MPQDGSDTRNEATVILRGKGNVILDLKTGTFKKIPGPFDAVPSIDGKIITVPGNHENNNSFTIYDRNNLSTPLFSDEGSSALVGVYQSVGLLESKNDDKTYRVITDTVTIASVETGVQNLFYKEYIVSGKGTDMTAKPAMDKPMPLCSNLNFYLKLPMISKDGLKLAAYNSETGTTNIFSINKNSNDQSVCNLEKDLGFASTKVEFSPDSKKITFASDSVPTTKDSVAWMSQPPTDMNMNVYVLDLKSNEITKLSNNTSGNAYYPSFSKDDTVTYLNQEYDKDKEKTDYSLIQAKVDNTKSVGLNPTDFYDFNACSYTKDDLAIMAIGKLWFKICSKRAGAPNVQGSRMIALSLEPEKCQSLVRKYWDDNRAIFSDSSISAQDLKQQKIVRIEKIEEKNIFQNYQPPPPPSSQIRTNNFINFRNLTADDLLKLCPTEKPEPAVLEVKKIIAEGEFKVLEMLSVSCSGCHSNGTGRSYIVGDAVTGKEHKQKAIEYVKSGYMPVGSVLTPEEKKEILEALDKL